MRGNAWSRGAEEFDAAVSGRAGATHTNAELLELVAALRAVPPVEARPEFVSSLRSQLVAAAERAPAQAEQDLAARLTPRQRRGSRERRLAAVVGGFAVVSASGSMAMAAQDALPGEVLYPVKRAMENAQTNLQPDGASKADTLLSHAQARLDEVQELTARGADAEVISSTLQDFTDQTEQASELTLDDYATTGETDPVAALRAFASDSMDVLGALGPIVPEDSRSILITATQTVRQVDLAAWEACPTCADGDVTELPDFALQQLSAVLSGEIPGQASVTRPTGETKPKQAPIEEPVSGEEAPTDLPTILPTDSPDLGKTVDDVTDPIVGGGSTDEPTDAPTTDGSQTTLTGTLVGGLDGILGGLLR